MSANMLLSAVQLARAASDLLLGPDSAPVYIEQRGPVLLVSQGDDHAYYAPSGALLERTEIGLRVDGARPEDPPDPEPDVFYVGEEAPPADCGSCGGSGSVRVFAPEDYGVSFESEECERCGGTGRDPEPREMVVMYAPAAEQPGPGVLERAAAVVELSRGEICECGAKHPDECDEYGDDLAGMSVGELVEEADNGCGGARALLHRRFRPAPG